MKTVLHLIETAGPGGAEKMLLSLVESLEHEQYRSVICFLKDGWTKAQLTRHGFQTIVIPPGRFWDIRWFQRFLRLISRLRVDLLHAHEFQMNSFGSLAALILRLPIITTVHGKNYYAEKWRRRAAYRFVARRSGSMVAVSEDINRFLRDVVGIRARDLTTIYNGIDVKAFARSEEGAKVRTDLGLPERAPVVGTIGSLYPVKGHRYLLKAAVRVIRLIPDTVFLFAGSGDLLKPLKAEAKELGIACQVKFLGFREDVPALLHAMDLFVLPSLSEGHPLSVLEAMAAGKPVIATDVGGIPEVVHEGETGFLVPPRDPETLASRITFLLRNRPLAYQMGVNGRQRVSDNFSLDHMVKAYQRLYEQALGPSCDPSIRS